MINHIDKEFEFHGEDLIGSINSALSDGKLSIKIDNEGFPELIWNIYSNELNNGYFILECVHPLKSLDVGSHFEWIILKKENNGFIDYITAADSPTKVFNSVSNSFKDVLKEIDIIEEKRIEALEREQNEYIRQMEWEQECFDREHFGGGRGFDEDDSFNDMMDDYEAWGNID